jgi:hypothetical protein
MSLHCERKLVYIPNVNFKQPLFELCDLHKIYDYNQKLNLALNKNILVSILA